MAIEDRNLTVGPRLMASYRKQAHVCMVERAEEGEDILFVLEGARKFKSDRRQRVRSWAARRSTAGASGPSKAPLHPLSWAKGLSSIVVPFQGVRSATSRWMRDTLSPTTIPY